MEDLCSKKLNSARRRRAELCRRRKAAGVRACSSFKRAKDDNGEDLSESTTDPGSSFDSTSSSSSSSSPSSSSSRSPQSDSSSGGEVGGFPCVLHGAVSVIGRRREMEDAVTVAPGFAAAGGGGARYDFFGVYDGHGGAEVAAACRERMHVVLAAEVERRAAAAAPSDVDWWREAMEACFTKVDEEVRGRAESGPASERTVGSTAVVAVVGAGRIVVANCGDSRAVLSRGGVPVPLSTDHKPDRPDELQRVEAAGGRVINWDGYRVLGVLATSRSIGDHYLKPFVTAEPEVTVTNRTDTDEFLVLASDGLWDVVSNEVACLIARRCLAGRPPWRGAEPRAAHEMPRRGADAAAALLAELALARGSRDNVSVVVVDLKRSRAGLS